MQWAMCVQQSTSVSSQALARRELQQVRKVKEAFYSLPPSPFLSLSVKQGHRLLEDPELSAESHAVGIHSVTASALIHLYTSVCI